MPKLTTYFFTCLALATFSVVGFAQTTTLDYLNSSLSTSACNVFHPAVNVNSVQHQSRAGGVSFTTSNGLKLSTTPGATNPGGTAFAIVYNFAPGYNYDIKITAKGNTRQMLLKTSVVPNFNQFQSNGTSLCVPDANVNGYATVGYGRIDGPVTTSSADYVVPQFSTTGTGAAYMVVWASGGNPDISTGDFLWISKIEIKKTALAPNFTIPASTDLTCSSTSPISINVVNTNGTTGITGYTWTLGSSANTWKDANGNPVGSTISTTGPSLTLTPVCVNTAQTISVTVATGSGNIASNTGSINITPPSSLPTYTISGPDVVCTSGNYSISGLPCGAIVTWSVSEQPGPLTTLSCTDCSQTTLSMGTGSGSEFLTATITSCGQTVNAYKRVRIGAYDTYSNFSTVGPSSACRNKSIQISVDPAAYPGLSNFVWSYPSGWFKPSGGTGSNYIALVVPSSALLQTYTISVMATNACGTTSTVNHIVGVTSCSSFMISPNPASEAITITEVEEGSGKPVQEMSLQRVEIVNKMGVVSYRKEYKEKLTGSLKIPVGLLRQDQYYVRIFDGVEWKAYPLRIQR